MYLDHYNLGKNPFQDKISQRALWLVDSLKEVALTLKRAIEVDKGIIVLYGDTGAGKNSLIRWVEQSLAGHYIIAKFSDPDIDYFDFFKLLSEQLNITKTFDTKSAFLVNFRNSLRKTFATRKHILLVLEDAHRFKTDILKELSLFADIEMRGKKILATLLVGDHIILELLKDEDLKEFSEKITKKYEIHQLVESETIKYIKSCLKIAGAKRKIFEKEAIQEIQSYSQGNLRLINTICDHALRVGYASGLNVVTADVLKQSRKELTTKFRAKKRANHFKVFYQNKHNQKPRQTYLNASSSSKNWSIAFAIILFIFSGFFVYFFEMKKFQSWTLEEIVPKSNKFPSLDNKIESLNSNQDIESTNPGKKSDLALTTELKPIKPIKKIIPATLASENRKADNLNIVRNDGKSTLFNKKFIIYFQHNSNALSKNAYEILGKLAGFMTENPDTKIVIEGYSDSSGQYSYNVTISKYRADSVKSYLLARKIAPERIESLGMGPEKPIYSNKTLEGRKLNRRVEIKLIAAK